MKTTELQKQLDGLWTIQDVSRRTGYTSMTIHNWRRQSGLPAVVIKGNERPTIRFVPDDVRKWARRNKIKLTGARK